MILEFLEHFYFTMDNIELESLRNKIRLLENRIGELESRLNKHLFGKDPKEVNPYKSRSRETVFIHKKPNFKTRDPIDFF